MRIENYIPAENIHGSDAAAVFTTRRGGVSGGMPGTEHLESLNMQYTAEGESEGNVTENYRIVTSELGFRTDDVFSVNQVHGDRIVIINEQRVRQQLHGEFNEDADALITDIEGILLSVRMADCVPILLYDNVKHVVAAVHSGWRGTFLRIGAKSVACMTEMFGTNPLDIQAAIGPAIGQCCYEVSFDLLEQFRGEFGTSVERFFCVEHLKNDERPHLDLKAMNRAFLVEAGIPECNIEVSDMCTCCRPELFFSHRRSGFKRGTMAAFIGMKTVNREAI